MIFGFALFVCLLLSGSLGAIVEMNDGDIAKELFELKTGFTFGESRDLSTEDEIERLKYGPCPEKNGKKEFDGTKFNKGKWYRHLRPYSERFEGLSCIVTHAGAKNGSYYPVEEHFVDTKTGVMQAVLLDLWISETKDAMGYFVYPRGDLPILPEQILETDYDNWAAAYTCLPLHQGRYHIDFGSIMGRNKLMKPEHLQKAKDALTAQGIDVSQLVGLDYDFCPPGFDKKFDF